MPAWRGCSPPAPISRSCANGAAELAYAADFRIGTSSVRIGNPETGLGILAAAGASWRLKELVGEPVAKQILLAGRVLTAEEALAVNLITGIHEAAELMDAARRPLERMLEMAGATVGKGDVGMPIIEDAQGGISPEDIDPAIDGD